MNTTLTALVTIYGHLLQISPKDSWRIDNQHVYATIRDSLAEITSVDAENVQKFCEAVSNANRNS